MLSFRPTGSCPIYLLALATSLTFSLPAVATNRIWYVSPNGLPSNNGSISSPLDLATALSGSSVAPGDTVWLRGGTYHGSFYSYLTGTASLPITVQGYQNERATIADTRTTAENSTFHIYGAWTIYRNFEVLNTSTTRYSSSLPPDFQRPMGVEIEGPNTKVVNLVIHDTGQGIGTWATATNSEVYGNIIYNNGWSAPDRGHGHGIYIQNDSGEKLIRDNIVFNQYGWGLHAYPNPGNIRDITMDGNIIFDNGVNLNPAYRYNQILVSGYAPWQAQGITISNNYIYVSPTQQYDGGVNGAALCLGCNGSAVEADVTLSGNYIANGIPSGALQGWTNMNVTNNNFICGIGYFVLSPPAGALASNYHWSSNTYSGTAVTAAAFLVGQADITPAIWQSAGSFDLNSTFSNNKPTTSVVFVRPNAYESGRAHVVVYNWGHNTRVQCDLSKVLTIGAHYEIHSATDYFGAPVVSGIFNGQPIALPLSAQTPQAATGGVNLTGTGPAFNVFVVLAR